MSADLNKFDIINLLAHRHGLRSYLEICTPSTGLKFAKVDAAWFETKHRLVYRCPQDANDGAPYTYRTTAESSRDIARTIFTAKDQTPPYDMIFVDPWHSLTASTEDLAGAWQLLRRGGFMIVHDCNPPDADYASPEFRPFGWCGETYRAFIDFLAFRNDAVFYTVNADFGCGVIRKLNFGEPEPSHDGLLLEWLYWHATADDPAIRYEYFDPRRTELLQLLSVDEFIEREHLTRDVQRAEAPDEPDQPNSIAAPWIKERPWIDNDDEDIALYVRDLDHPPSYDLESKLFQWRDSGFVTFEGAASSELIEALLADVEAFKQNFTNYKIPIEIRGKQIESTDIPSFPDERTGIKINHLHCYSGAATLLSLTSEVCDFLRHIFRAPPAAMQSLTFWRGSEQRTHVDYPYVNYHKRLSFLAAAWIALEDVNPDAGPLGYYPGGHKISNSGFFDWGNGSIIHSGESARTPMEFADHLEAAMSKKGIARKEFCPKKGDIFVWHGNLPHEGTPVRNPTMTRKSYVTHYTSLSDFPDWLRPAPGESRTNIVQANGGVCFVGPAHARRARLPSWEGLIEKSARFATSVAGE